MTSNEDCLDGGREMSPRRILPYPHGAQEIGGLLMNSKTSEDIPSVRKLISKPNWNPGERVRLSKMRSKTRSYKYPLPGRSERWRFQESLSCRGSKLMTGGPILKPISGNTSR
ncbi:unnamed protein product [Ilex paraguariensis]|uniref:Uncharacterized protein n=1 Tax=Ilex paraguariensis TaxID=185542 RepID=A0ABC8SF38_9AQUA